jgi:hypothetical protein
VAWGVECGVRAVLLAVRGVKCVKYGAPPDQDWSGGGTGRHAADAVGVS